MRDAVARSAEQIAQHVRLGTLRPELAEEPYRFLTPTSFPYVIVYNADRRPPLIVRILHGARDLLEILRQL